jgi:hypothetical protein
MRGASRLAACLALAACTAHAQLAPVDPDWRELEAPPPPAVRLDGLVPLEMPGSTLRFGVDPASISIAGDGVVRYVVVATGAGGAVNALYEGLRCSTGESRVYARYLPGSGWKPATASQWRSLRDTPGSNHSLVFARNAACVGQAPNRSASQIVRDLQAPVDTRFNQLR